MRRTGNLAILCAVCCFAWAAAAHAQPQPDKEDSPGVAPAASPSAPALADAPATQPASTKPAKAEPQAGKQPANDPTRLDSAAIAEWAKRLKARAQEEGPWLTVGDICEVKHYKQDKLQGFGLVVDLEDVVRQEEKSEEREISSVLRSTRASSTRLADVLEILNTPVGEGDLAAKVANLFQPDQLAMAAVTATVPPEGVRNGDRIDCEVRALGGKSITDGYLLPTQLSAPGPKMEAPAAMAAGPVARESSYRSGPAKVASGCLIQSDICDEFVKEDKITLILDEEHAEFPIAQDAVNLINAEMGVAMNQPLAKALNRHLVEVMVPDSFADDPVAFVTLILRLETQIPAPEEEPEERPFRLRSSGGLE
jgi:flagellar P-ring protein precursor FlgI